MPSTFSRSARRPFACASSLLLSLGLLACGGSDEAPAGPAQPAPVAPPASTQEPQQPAPTPQEPTPQEPTPSEPTPGTIAFVCEQDDGANDELCVMDGDGARVRRLTHNAGPDRAPSWSPDGRQLVFNSRRAPHADRPQIYRLDVAARAIVRVSSSPLEDQRASWAPDGLAVVFQRGNFEQGFELFRQQLADSALTALTADPGKINAAGSYSPDGSKLLFQSNRGADGLFPFSTYVLSFADQALTKVGAAITSSHDGPRWSPDGQRVAFAAGGSLYVSNVGSGELITVTDGAHDDSAPAWSPDGSALVFQSDRVDEERTSLHVIDLATFAVTDLGFGRTPVWTAAVFAADVLDADPPLEPGTPDDPCAPHGEQHGDHCHCDEGYVEDGLACVPAAAP